MHYSGPRGRLPSVRAVKPPPPTDKPYCAVRRFIVHTSRRSALALKPSRDCPLSLDHLQTSCLPVSAPHIASACHLEVALTMMRLRTICFFLINFFLALLACACARSSFTAKTNGRVGRHGRASPSQGFEQMHSIRSARGMRGSRFVAHLVFKWT